MFFDLRGRGCRALYFAAPQMVVCFTGYGDNLFIASKISVRFCLANATLMLAADLGPPHNLLVRLCAASRFAMTIFDFTKYMTVCGVHSKRTLLKFLIPENSFRVRVARGLLSFVKNKKGIAAKGKEIRAKNTMTLIRFSIDSTSLVKLPHTSKTKARRGMQAMAQHKIVYPHTFHLEKVIWNTSFEFSLRIGFHTLNSLKLS